MIAVSTIFAVSTLMMSYFCPVTAQSLVPGIHAMSTMQGVRFISLNVTGEKEISFNIKYLGSGSTPPVLIVATALTNGTDYQPGMATTTMGGSEILDAGWSSPKSMAMKIIGIDKAPFEIILSSASIPLSEIDNYRMVASSQ